MKTKEPTSTLLSKTVITISPDGVITITKIEETNSEQMMAKVE